MKKLYRKPEVEIEGFVPNEYVAFCGMTDDGTWLVGEGVIETKKAYTRYPAGIPNYIQDDDLSEPYLIYKGSFYKDGKLDAPDSTHLGHETNTNTFDSVECVVGPDDGNSKQPWGYHYHFIKTSNYS